jgi:pimeloyl-CoA synthetase
MSNVCQRKRPSNGHCRNSSKREVSTLDFVNIRIKKIITNLNFITKRLALYVYEYLMHLGAKNSAQTFLQEVNILNFSLEDFISFTKIIFSF